MTLNNVARTYRKTALYLHGDADEIVQQDYTLEQFADEHNLRYLRFYRDEQADRSELERLLANIEADAVSILLVTHLSVLGNMDFLEGLSLKLKEHNVRLIAVNDLLNVKEHPMARERMENGIHYTLHGDYYLPDINSFGRDKQTIGRWGWRHLNYLRKHKPETYQQMVKDSSLYAYLVEINKQAEYRHRFVMHQILSNEATMNNIIPTDAPWQTKVSTACAMADENVLFEMIYV